jgi:hypothetical protein
VVIVRSGERLYKLWQRRRGVLLSLVAAVIACVLVLYRPTLLPPGLHTRGLTIGSASGEVLVARPNLAVGATSYDYEALVNSATLVGNMMTSGAVLEDAARAVGVPASRIQATAPMTANVPRTLIEPGSGGFATDLVASPDHYKLEIQADPSVPVLHVYAEAPSAAAAKKLADAAIKGTAIYLAANQARANVPVGTRIAVQQLGPVQGGVANPGGPVQIALLVFLGVFGACLFLTAIIAHVSRGFRTARLAEQLQS